MFVRNFFISAAVGLLGAVPMFAAGPSFSPDATFHGSSLSDFHALGQANWRAENGELIGTPQNSGGGWLMSDRSYQDVALFTNFRCTGGCETGALFRIEKSGDGYKGYFVSLTERDTPSYLVTLDAQGKILTRERLRRGGGLIRVAPPAIPNAPTSPANIPRYNVKLPFTPPDTGLKPNDWNAIEFLYDANIVRAVLNYGREAGGVTEEDGYGPFALYVAGTGEVRFKDVAYANLGLRVREPNRTASDFRKQQISDFYYSMTAAAADFNHDGILDVVSGPYIYYGPDYTKRSEIALAESTSPSTSFNSWWVEYAADFTGDGWPDVINVTYGGPNAGVYLYVNPKGENPPLGQVQGSVQRSKRNCRDGRCRRQRQARGGLHGRRVRQLRQAGSSQSNRTVDCEARFRAGLRHRSWPRHRRCERRRTHGHPECVRLVGAAACGRRSAVEIPF